MERSIRVPRKSPACRRRWCCAATTCIAYHVIRCKELGVSNEQLFEVLNVGLIVGGSIVIPHLRRAVELMDEIDEVNG